jgi:hypothetical protein
MQHSTVVRVMWELKQFIRVMGKHIEAKQNLNGSTFYVPVCMYQGIWIYVSQFNFIIAL